jgi:FHA domain
VAATTGAPAPVSSAWEVLAPRATEAIVRPIGDLVGTDGARIPLDRAYVIGREPEADPIVMNGTATPVRLGDDDNLISRVQCYITVQGGQVALKDASSANGTFVAAPGDQAWTRLGADAVLLPPTWSMRVGNRVFTYVAAAAWS